MRLIYKTLSVILCVSVGMCLCLCEQSTAAWKLQRMRGASISVCKKHMLNSMDFIFLPQEQSLVTEAPLSDRW